MDVCDFLIPTWAGWQLKIVPAPVLLGGAAKTGIGLIKDEEGRALSGAEIDHLLPGITVLTYPDLAKVAQLETLLDNPQQAAAILFVTRSADGVNEGHWLALFRRADGKVLFFDPYGKMPDTHREWLPAAKLRALGEKAPLLMPLIREFGARGGEVLASDIAVQSSSPSIATCGRHLIMRLKNRDISDDEYLRLISSGGRGVTPDAFVTHETEGMLRATPLPASSA